MKVYTQSVGIRELRTHLSNYLKHVRAGGTITVTDHGEAIAVLRPIEYESPIEKLLAEGIATAPTMPMSLPIPIEIEGTVSDLVADQRR